MRSPRPLLLAAAIALAVLVQIPPYERFARESLGAHMLQHVVLMSIVPPLLVLGRPRVLRLDVEPWSAWLAIAVVMGIWHIPWLYYSFQVHIGGFWILRFHYGLQFSR